MRLLLAPTMAIEDGFIIFRTAPDRMMYPPFIQLPQDHEIERPIGLYTL
jgi:hypothetical protein